MKQVLAGCPHIGFGTLLTPNVWVGFGRHDFADEVWVFAFTGWNGFAGEGARREEGDGNKGRENDDEEGERKGEEEKGVINQ